MDPVSTLRPIRANEIATPAAERTPPHNDEAEMALLGAILHNNRAFERVVDFLRPEHFASRVHGRIFEAIGRLVDRGLIADPITLKQYFEADADLAEIGGYAYLMRLAGSVASIVNAEDYGRAVHDLHLRRQLISLGEDIVNDAYRDDLDNEAVSQIEGAEQRLFTLASTGEIESGLQAFGTALKASIDAANAAFRREGQLAGVPSGFTDLDKLLGGLHPSDLLILAGRPSMGKTALATNIAFYAARTVDPLLSGAKGAGGADGEANRNHIVAFFSLEMSAEQLATRILAEQTGIPSERIRRGELSNDDFERLVVVSQELERLPLYIDDTPALSIAALRTRARRLKRSPGLSMIVVDYLQLMHGASTARNENRVQELSEITRGLKTVAKELAVPVVALSQLSRAVENREDKRPQLADLRESGSIEQDADVVMFVYRDEYYLARKEPREGTPEHVTWQEEMEKVHKLAEVIIGKQRHGPIGKVTLQFEGETTRFSNYVADDHLPDARY
jgi:replicative DNA helicase